MIYAIEYKNFRLFKKHFLALTQKYPKEIPTVRIRYVKKFDAKPYRYLRKKGLNIEVELELNYLSVSIIKKANAKRFNLFLTCQKQPKKIALKKANYLKNLTAIICKNEDHLQSLEKVNSLLVETDKVSTPFKADILNLCTVGKTFYTCQTNSCLGKTLCVSVNGEVSYCLKDKLNTVIGKIDDQTEFFDDENFIKLLEKQIEKRENCKNTCKLFPLCKGGCAINDGCEQFKKEFFDARSTFANILNSQTNLKDLPRYQAESVLLSATNGNLFIKENNAE